MRATGSAADPPNGSDRITPVVRAAAGLLAVYKRYLSPLLPKACRFHPTCSEYARQAFIRHGLAHGAGLALRRLCRCHPFHEGGFDPVP
jgi:putative membrane protein insertion efficiency factor